MKEILYIQAGSFSNYVGTHFWNTQETYLSDDDSTDARISFRSSTVKEHQTLCPRLLMFDWKGNFGTLNRSNALGSEMQETSGALWNGNVEEIRQMPIPRSAYQNHLADGEMGESETRYFAEDVRYWSDYTRVYYTPDTIQQVPEPSERQDPIGNWGVGVDMFRRYSEESDLMDGSVRLSLEECDTLQGLQLLNDCDSFGGFVASFLTAFKDDYGKTTSLVFAMLSGNTSGINFDMSDPMVIKSALTDALYLRGVSDLASLTIPVQPPSRWPSGIWTDVNGFPIVHYHG